MAGAVGFVLSRGDELLAYRSAGVRVCCPIQTEATALKEAIGYTRQRGISCCIFYNDYQTLVNQCQDLHDSS